jgi:hypothetical protein
VIGRALLAMVALTTPAHARVVFTNTDEVRACVPLAGGDTLAGTAGGLVRVDPAGLARRVWTASNGLPGTRIDALVADGERVWVGTDGGVAEFAGDVSHAVATRPVRDIARWQGTTYLATWDGGVIAVGPAPGGTAVAMHGGPAAQRMQASSLAVAGGTLWAGSAAGLYQMRNGKLERIDGPRDVTALVADGATLWIGTSDGLWTRDGHRVRALGGGKVRHLALVDGAIVAAGADGLTTVDRARVVPLAGAPRGFAQAIGAAQGAACAGGLDGLWTRAHGAWHHGPRPAVRRRATSPPSSPTARACGSAVSTRAWPATIRIAAGSASPVPAAPTRGSTRSSSSPAPTARASGLPPSRDRTLARMAGTAD